MKELSSPARTANLVVLLLAALATFLPLYLLEQAAMLQTGGVFSYPVDDAFIHMQIAENLSDHGVWGINPTQFSSASSSLLYTMLLALSFKFTSHHLYVPLVINIIAAIALLFVAQRWLQRQQIRAAWQLVILLASIVLVPIPVMIMSGMEHTLECLFSFLFLTSFADMYGRDERNDKRPFLRMVLMAVLAVSVRYECLFMVGTACLILLFRKQWKQMFILGVAALLPVIIFGLYSLTKGSYFVPNSLLVKSEAAQFSVRGLISAFGNILINRLSFAPAGVTLLATQKLLMLLPLCFLFFRNFIRESRVAGDLLIILTGTTFLQLVLADTGKFYRYEAYLIFCACIVVGWIISRSARPAWSTYQLLPKFIIGFLAFYLMFPLVLRSLAALTKSSRASVNIYEQQYQMGRFFHTYYDTTVIAANDIGAVSYFTKGDIVDLWGLATIEVARSKKGNYWNAPFLDSLTRAKHTKVAAIYDSWIDKAIPPNWKKIAGWRIFNNVVCGDDVVYFYAVDPNEAPQLLTNLKAFETHLPRTVAVTYYPINPAP